jgi:glutamate synthase domain-containing protein 2
VSQLGGVGLEVIAAESAARHAVAYPPEGVHNAHRKLWVGGEYQWRREGEPHLFDPETVFRLQHATRQRRYDIFKQYTARIDEQAQRLMTLRGLFDSRRPVSARPDPDRAGRAGQRDRHPIPHRRDVLRLDQSGGPRDPRDRDEPPRRQVQHR